MAPRNHEIVIKLSKDELEKIKDKANSLGLPLSTFGRMLLLSAKTPIIEG